MPDHVLTRRGGRILCYEDWTGLVHVCKGFAARGRMPIYWTLCRLDVPAGKVHAHARHEPITCPDCLDVACEPARRILAAPRCTQRAAAGGLPFKPDRD